jgi:hypothetical protein
VPGKLFLNFLMSVIQLAIEEKTKKYGEGIGNTFIESYLSNNIHGFEVMLPLYIMGYLNLLKVIKSFCRGTMRKAPCAMRFLPGRRGQFIFNRYV